MPRGATIRVAVALAVACGGVAAGCGDVDGGASAFPGASIFQSPGGGYRFRVLMPPWEVVWASGDSAQLIVPAVTGAPVTTTDVLVRLAVAPESAAYATAAARAAATRAEHGDEAGAATTIRDVQGREIGAEVSWVDAATGLHHRDGYLRSASGASSFSMAFSGKRQLQDDLFVTQMLVSFEVGAGRPGTGGAGGGAGAGGGS